ncbi:hypothetical protein FBU59_003085 [Linderina macrospora]|uniref:Uncharacterized protein n=1 Tax=Linderina macrospora TaxID=4868 RepID=A0ACC1J9G3_9FUNG|nr:hypothetical protein FBU59_003085 [Linderina macrospora]
MSSFKIASLLFRTLSKPVASALKTQAKDREVFRSLCINVAQTTHRIEMTWKMKVLGYQPERIRPLNDARAVDAGANFLGEAFIFSVAVSLIFAEQLRSRNQARKQRNAVDDRLDKLEAESGEAKEQVQRLREERDLLRGEIDELARESAALGDILRKVLGKELDRWSAEHGYPATKINQDVVERFTNGENVDSAIREMVAATPAATPTATSE